MAKNNIQVKILGDAKGLTGAVDKADGKLGQLGTSIGKIGLALGAMGGLAAGAMLKLGGEFDSAIDSIIVGTGASGAALDDLTEQFEDVFTGIPVSSGDAANAIQGLNTVLGYTGDELEMVATSTLEMARMSGAAIDPLIRNIGGVAAQWGLTSDGVNDYNDLIFGASQASGASVDKLSAGVTTFGAVWQNAGASLDETVGFMAQLEKGGIALTRVMPGINAATRKWAEDGKVATEEFAKVQDAILAATSEAEALAIATDAFGAEGAQRVSQGIRTGIIDFENMGAIVSDTEGSIAETAAATESWQEKLKMLTNQIKVKLAPIANKVFTAVGDAIEKLMPHIETAEKWLRVNVPKAMNKIRPIAKRVFGAVKTAIKSVVDFVTTNWPKVQDAVLTVFKWLKDNKTTVIGALGGFALAMAAFGVAAAIAALPAWSVVAAMVAAAAPAILITAGLVALGAAVFYAYENFEGFRKVVDSVAAFLVDTVWPKIQEFVGFLVDEFKKMKDFIVDNWETIQKAVENVLKFLKGVFNFYVKFYTKVWEIFGGTIVRWINTAFGLVKTIITSVMDIVKGIIKTVTSVIAGDWGKAWDGIKETLSGVWNLIKAIPQTALNFIFDEVKRILGKIKTKMGELWGKVATKVDEVWEGIKSGIGTAIDAVIGFITGIPGRVGSAIGDGFRSIWTNFKKYANMIVDGWNNLSFTLPEVDTKIPGIGKIGGWTINTPNIPRFSDGPVFYHDGGPVGNLKSNEVPAVLQTGEFVLSRKMLANMGKSGGAQQPTVNIENAVFNDGQDAEMLAATINFRMA